MVTDQAFATGITAIPGPISDVSNDWIIYQPFAQRFTLLTAVGFVVDSSLDYVIDGKAQRVVQPDETIAFVLETNSESEGLIYQVIGRVLSRVRGTH